MQYDLEERTRKFSKNIISLIKNLQTNNLNKMFFLNWYDHPQVLELTIVKQMLQVQKKIFETKYLYVVKKYRKPNTGLNYLLR